MRRILLTPDQEKTLLSVSSCVSTFDGGCPFYYFPFFLKELGNGMFEQLTWSELPPYVKDMVASNAGLNLPTPKHTDDTSTQCDSDMR